MIQGLPLLSAVFGADDHESLVEMIRNRVLDGSKFADSFMPGSRTHWLDLATDQLEQEERAVNWPSERDADQNSRKTMTFGGDSLNSPPLAWTIIWKGRYGNLFGSFIPKALQLWGYVFWDGQRLDAGVKEHIMTRYLVG